MCSRNPEPRALGQWNGGNVNGSLLRSSTSLVLGLALLCVSLLSGSPEARASSLNPAFCASSVDYVGPPGRDYPVILVHGFGGYSKNQFGSMADPASIMSRVSQLTGYRFVQQFQYQQGVNTFGGNSERLAQTIDCAARISAQAGGPGKVVVIGYSEGAALLHAASRKAAWDRTALISDELALVITIGDAFRLGWLAVEGMVLNVPFASGFPVHAIGGDVTKVQVRGGKDGKVQDTDSDDLIPVGDALVSGTSIFRAECRRVYSDAQFKKMTTDAPCRHGELLNYGPVRQSVEDALREFAPPPETSGRTLVVGSLEMTYPEPSWSNVGYGATGPGGDSFASDQTNAALCTNCSAEPPPMVYAFVQVTNLAGWCATSAAECMARDLQVVGVAPPLNIDGRVPSWSARLEEPSYQGTQLMWCFDAEMVCIGYRRASDVYLEPSQAFLDVAAGARWVG